MTEPASAKETRSLALAAARRGAPRPLACGASYFEIPIETPIQAEARRVGLPARADRGLRRRRHRRRRRQPGNGPAAAQPAPHRSRRCGSSTPTSCRCIDDRAGTEQDAVGGDARRASRRSRRAGRQRPPTSAGGQPLPLPQDIKEEKDLEPYERLFANTAYWKRIGEEYQNPLIVTGTVLFTPHSRSGFVQRESGSSISFGRRRVVPVRTYMERKGFILRPKFVFIDGRTGAAIYSEATARKFSTTRSRTRRRCRPISS